MNPTAKEKYQFGQFYLDPGERRLLRDGEEIHIRPRAFDMLTHFVRNPNRLISAEELMNAVWLDAYVEVSNVQVVISELRRILGRDSIKAVWRSGYRFEVTVHISITTNSVHGSNNLQTRLEQETATTLRVFLCHSSTDKPIVRDLYRRLKSEGLRPWLDEEDLLAGQAWEQEIPKAIRNSDIVIVCLSCRAVTKTGYVQKEIKFGLDIADEQPDGAIFLVPVRLEKCEIPERLRRWHCVNLFEEEGYDKLLRALRFRATQIRSAGS